MKALQPRLAIPTYLFRFRLRQAENPGHQTSDPFWGCSRSSTEVREGDRQMEFFVGTTTSAASQFPGRNPDATHHKPLARLRICG